MALTLGFDAFFRFAEAVGEVGQQLFFARNHVAQFVHAGFRFADNQSGR